MLLLGSGRVKPRWLNFPQHPPKPTHPAIPRLFLISTTFQTKLPRQFCFSQGKTSKSVTKWNKINQAAKVLGRAAESINPKHPCVCTDNTELLEVLDNYEKWIILLCCTVPESKELQEMSSGDDMMFSCRINSPSRNQDFLPRSALHQAALYILKHSALIL